MGVAESDAQGVAMHQLETALALGHRQQRPVELLVRGRWLHGLVESMDGRGVWIFSRHAGPVLVPLEVITVARVLEAPERRPLTMRRVRSG